MTGRKLLMTFPVTATSHGIEDYCARGGYATLERVRREMRPEEVTKEVAASGILGHGGAAFPAGRKWGVIKLNDEQPHYLCANADEGEPGTFKDRWILEHAPHLLIESMAIAAHALQVRHAFIYIRGEFDLPYRRIAAAVEEAYAAGWLGASDAAALDIVVYRGAGSYVCGEGVGIAHVARGPEGLSAQPAAAPHGARASTSGRPSSTTSRRWPTSPASSATAPRRSAASAPRRARARS
jgi:NADH-quinone oxidoreductase subunit F